MAGPRSLYHADGHEKLFHVWGVIFHGCIDGYSRYIIYLKAAPDKTAETVRAIFVTGCEEEGWSSRVRADKGSEQLLCTRAGGVEKLFLGARRARAVSRRFLDARRARAVSPHFEMGRDILLGTRASCTT